MRRLNNINLTVAIVSIALLLKILSTAALAKDNRTFPSAEPALGPRYANEIYLPLVEGWDELLIHVPTPTRTAVPSSTPTSTTCPFNNLIFVSGTKGDFVTWFNATARRQDEALANMINASVLAGITIGRKDVFDPSYADAQMKLPPIASQINLIGYDLEHWSLTPANEQADPIGTVKAFSAFAHSLGLWFNVVPDRSYMSQYGPQFAPYAEQMTLQLQRLQTDNTVLLNYAIAMANRLRAANPKLKIIAQFDTSGGVSQLVTLTGALKPYIDGVSVFTPLGTEQVTKDFASQYIMCK